MPRASYSDKYTVTVHGKTHVVLDFTSKVIDFVYLDDADGGKLFHSSSKKTLINLFVSRPMCGNSSRFN